MDHFGRSDPKLMPTHLFQGAISLQYETAMRGDIEKQNYSICPRHWYLDAKFQCSRCKIPFLWSAQEQRRWFEDYRFWIDSIPKHCPACRAERRRLAKLRQEYDTLIAQAVKQATPELQARIVDILLQLKRYPNCLTDKMSRTLARFQQAIH